MLDSLFLPSMLNNSLPDCDSNASSITLFHNETSDKAFKLSFDSSFGEPHSDQRLNLDDGVDVNFWFLLWHDKLLNLGQSRILDARSVWVNVDS